MVAPHAGGHQQEHGAQGPSSWINDERSPCEGEQAARAFRLPWIVFNPAHSLGPGDRHNGSRPIVGIDRRKRPGTAPGTGSMAPDPLRAIKDAGLLPH